MENEWIEIIVKGPEAKRDASIALLIRHGSPGVEELDWTDADLRGKNSNAPVFALKGFVPGASGAKVKTLCAELKKLGLSVKRSDYTDEDWKEKWKEGLKPVRVVAGARRNGSSAKRLVIKPTWTNLKKEPGDIFIDIDPGMAFGTGHHATTKLCLKALLEFPGRGKERAMLDVGTGTGVLAMAAKKLGFRRAVGIDVDPIALDVARKNARLNRVAASFSTRATGATPGTFDFVAANIISSVLLKLKPELLKKLKPNARLVLSGILAIEARGVREAFLEESPLGFVKLYRGGEWAALVFEKKGARACRP
jgi:ribosomal protein L11 methyltransferase